MKHLITLLLTITLSCSYAQTPEQWLDRFEDGFQYQPFNGTPFPWQSFRLIPFLSFQVDFICDSLELDLLTKEPWLLERELLSTFHGWPFGGSKGELIQRYYNKPGSYKVHIPGLTVPYDRQFIPRRPDLFSVDFSKNGLNGCYFRVVGENLLVGVLDLGSGKFQVSSCMILQGLNDFSYSAAVMPNVFLTLK